MKAWRVHEVGDPATALVMDDIDPPVPGPNEVVVDVTTTSLNFPDVLMCRGEYQVKPPAPFTPGAEVSGIVSALGDGASSDLLGRRVIAVPTPRTGGFTEQTVAPVGTVFPIPDSLDDAAAAALHITYQTGHIGLHRRAGLRAGETLLVHAGAGGVGSAAIQLGLAAGARVIATAGGAEKVQVCRDLGADLVIDYRAGDFVDAVKEFTNGEGADVIYDPVGGDVYDRSTKCVAFEGRILIVGFTGGRIADARTNHILIKNYSVVGVHWLRYPIMQPKFVHETHAELMRLHEAALIAPLISREIPMEDVPSALASLATRGTWGKIVARW